MTRTAGIALTLAILLAAPAAAQRLGVGSYGKAPMPGEKGPLSPENIGFDQKIGAAVPLDQELYDHDGKVVTLRSLAAGKPTILVLAYYRCPKLCNEVLTSLLDALKDVRRDDPKNVAGGPFNVVAISIDPREGPALARVKRESYLREYDGRSPDQPGWWFLTASHGQGTDIKTADQSVHALADAIGFRYSLRYRMREYHYGADTGAWTTATGDPLRDQPRDYDYGHASGITFLTPDGRVSSYLLGINYQAADVKVALATAGAGKTGGLVPKELAEKLPACFVYDEVTGKYRPTMLALAIVSAPVFLLVLFIAGRTVRRGLRETPLTPPPEVLARLAAPQTVPPTTHAAPAANG
ncbi:SCO family protein [Fimbriiglobus ruber]|uniref:SCO1/SenC family protein n=1 Tax=Fimbriiglobus ruber TaxID=1908690 RepID=A0A225DCD5_9BACT|nr:SCO family protein [Fimbriiglobus ruber]OWK36198.1 SCO1/SenC family protein [Fimbriiglobus ruber]